MAIVKQTVGPRTAVNANGLATLANGLYAQSDALNNTTNQPGDLLIELAATSGTGSGNKQLVVFAIASLDGTNYQTGVNATDEVVMTRLGTLQLPSNNTAQRTFFTLAAFYGGVLPPYVKILVKNDSGAGISGAGLFVSEIALSVV